MSSAALMARVDAVSLFAEIEPNQKEQILLALKRAGHVVGYLGDGINDASALHAADVGLSVESAAVHRAAGGHPRPVYADRRAYQAHLLPTDAGPGDASASCARRSAHQ